MNVCGLCEQQLEHDYLCPGCARATTERLDRMPRLWAALAAFLAPGSGAAAQYGHTSPVEAPLPVRENVLNLRAAGGIAGVLEDWRAAMQEDRGWGRPAIPAAIDRRIAVAARALVINMDWIVSSWPTAGDMAHEVRDLEAAALSVIDPEDRDELRARRGTRLDSYCVAQLPDEEVCGAVLRSFPGRADVVCEWCGTVYGPRDYLMLKELQPDAA